MPDTLAHENSISGQPLERSIDRIGPQGYFYPQTAARTDWITVRLTGARSSTLGSDRGLAKTGPAAWAGDVFLRLQQLRGYPKNWDSYGGRPLTTAAYLGAYNLLGRLMFERAPKPSVVPTGPGGVQFEWHKKGSHVEVYISPDGNAEVSFEDDFGSE